MLKAGIITFHNAENYGASLQTYALMKTLQKLGCECKIIDYRNKGVFYRNLIKNFYYLFTFQNPIKNQQNFRYFRNNYLTLTKKSYSSAADFEKDADQFDCLFFGSDQIWNPDLSNGFDNLYFGQFNTSSKKIAYAASFGREKFSSSDLELINHLVQNFKAISVREQTMLPHLRQDAECVLDPCLLLSIQEWEEIIEKRVVNEDYILIYQLHQDKSIIATAKKLAKKNNCLIKVISPYLFLTGDRNIQIVGHITPNEFINLFCHADKILSDSFHGTGFSILFQKPFYTFLPQKKAGRITSLLGKLNLSDRITSINRIPLGKIDYQEVNRNLMNEINRSLAFIKKNLS